MKKATPITPTHGSRCEEPSSAPLTPQSSNNLAPSKPPDLGELSGSEDERGGKPKKKKSRICESLSRLGVYTHSAHFTSFNQAEATQPPHVFSVSENQIQEIRSTHQAELFGHNRNYLMRAYPAGRRIDSSNPDPSTFWRTGVQMVALNWQSWDEGMMLNEAMFADEQGWVLKPPAYRCCNGDADPLPAVNRVTIDFKITVLAGQDIPLPLEGHKNGFYPHVKCELHVDKPNSHSLGPESGWTKEGKYKRISKPAEGTNPDFGNDGAELSFLGVPNVVEELSFVRYVVSSSVLRILIRLVRKRPHCGPCLYFPQSTPPSPTTDAKALSEQAESCNHSKPTHRAVVTRVFFFQQLTSPNHIFPFPSLNPILHHFIPAQFFSSKHTIQRIKPTPARGTSADIFLPYRHI